MGSLDVDHAVDTGAAGWISYAHWVRDALALMRSGTPGKIGLFESSVPEPSAMLASTVAAAFRHGPPASYQSVFMRSNPDVVARLSERYGVPNQNIFCTTGATTSVSLLYRSLLTMGDRVLIEKPGFDIFANCAYDVDVEPHFFERPAPNFEISVERVLAELHPRTRMVVISDIHNPSGRIANQGVLNKLADELLGRGIFLMIDEVYRDYAGDEDGPLAPDWHPNIIRVSSLTKTFGLSTLRCGWIVADTELLAKVRAHAELAEFGVSKLAHSVAAEVLAQSDDYDNWRREHMKAAKPAAARRARRSEANRSEARDAETRRRRVARAEEPRWTARVLLQLYRLHRLHRRRALFRRQKMLRSLASSIKSRACSRNRSSAPRSR